MSAEAIGAIVVESGVKDVPLDGKVTSNTWKVIQQAIGDATIPGERIAGHKPAMLYTAPTAPKL